MFKNKKNTEQWYFYINNKPRNIGMNKYIWRQQPRYTGKILFKTIWEKWSLAEKIVIFTKENIVNYKLKNKYIHIPGPNCNTLTQRVLNKFPEIKIKLPRNAFWKSYTIK